MDAEIQFLCMQGPEGEWLKYGSEHFVKSEEAGVKEARRAAFVLVAGGLGERLGYSGVKVGHDPVSTPCSLSQPVIHEIV